MRVSAPCARTALLGVLTVTLTACLNDSQVAGVFGGGFTANLLQARTFISGTAVTTVTYQDAGDGQGRRAFGVDFNGDGKIDPVVTYGGTQAVFQILLSNGDVGTVNYVPLTLDSKRDMEDLADVAVGDIDGDGRLDLVGGAKEAIWYFRQPNEGATYLRGWGNTEADDELREKIEASVVILSDDDVAAIIDAAVPDTVNLADYIITIRSVYEDVEIGDMDQDGFDDIVGARTFHIHLEPLPNLPLETIDIYDGDVVAYLNPGAAEDGRGWSAISAGRHERQLRLDRDGSAGMQLYDLDGDGDLDIVSAARYDNNVQVAWFENPLGAPGALLPDIPWTQWRIGSVRDAWNIALTDVTGDDRPDVVATGQSQQQVLLFAQPPTGPKREFDWDTSVVATFESFEPRAVLAVDIDNDGTREVVVGCTDGAVRYFEPSSNLTTEWTPLRVADIVPAGSVGMLGYGDLDADGDLDLVAVLDGAESENDATLNWIRNDLGN